MPKILLKFNAAVIKEIPITKLPLTIGRKPENDIVIDNLAVSSHHAKLVLEGESYFIEDLNSTNGTFVNDRKILKLDLKNKDEVMIGKHSLVFIHEGQEAPAPAASAGPASDLGERTIVVEKKPAPANPTGATAAPVKQEVGGLTVMEGVVGNQTDYTLAQNMTYVGKGDQATVKIKGLFAPDIACFFNRRPTGYLIVAVKKGYVKVNGEPLKEQREVKNGDTIEAGGSKFIFYMKEI